MTHSHARTIVDALVAGSSLAVGKQPLIDNGGDLCFTVCMDANGTQEKQMTEKTIFDTLGHGTVVHGPAPRPRVIESPKVMSVEDYADTQTDDEVKDGDVLVARVNGELVVGVMVEAWPVLVSGPGEDLGFHTLNEDADIHTLGSYPYGRYFEMSWGVDYMPPKGGADYTASWELAHRTAKTFA